MPRFATFACAVVLTAAPFALPSVSASNNDRSVDTTVPVTEPTFVYDLEKEPSDCIGFLPKPGCGKAPQQSGDRGGVMQYVVFAVMLTGVGIIATVLIRNVIKRDRALAEQLTKSEK